MKLVTVEQVRAIEQEADSIGLTYAQMMEHAGHALARSVMEMSYLHEDESPEILERRNRPAVCQKFSTGPLNNSGISQFQRA